MPGFLKQATASQSRLIGPFIDSGDFVTLETGLTIANTDVKLSANGGASADKNSGGGTHRVNGMYSFTFDATDTATVGQLSVSIAATGALIVWDTFTVLEEAVYDALFAASAPGYVANAPVNVAQFGGSNLTSASGIPEVRVASMANNSMTAAAAASDLTTELQSGLATASAVSTLQTSVDDLPTNAELATALGTADDAVLAQVALVKAETDKIADVLADTNELQTDWVNGGRLDLILDARASQTSVDDLPTNSELATALDALPTAAENADAVWDEAIAGHSGSGSTGEALAAAGAAGDPWITALPGSYTSGQAGYILGTNLNATVSSRATQTSVDDLPTNAELATALASADDAVLAAIGDLPTNAELATALGTADDAVLTAIDALPTAVENADALLGRSIAGGANGGRMVKDALKALRNRVGIATGTMTVYEADDSTPAWTAAVTQTAGDPLSEIDPT